MVEASGGMFPASTFPGVMPPSSTPQAVSTTAHKRPLMPLVMASAAPDATPRNRSGAHPSANHRLQPVVLAAVVIPQSMGSHRKSIELDMRALLDALRHLVRELRQSATAAERRLGISGAQLFVLQNLARKKARSLN